MIEELNTVDCYKANFAFDLPALRPRIPKALPSPKGAV